MYLYLGKQEIDDGEKVKVISVDYLYDTDYNNVEKDFTEFETRGAGKRTFLDVKGPISMLIDLSLTK